MRRPLTAAMLCATLLWTAASELAAAEWLSEVSFANAANAVSEIAGVGKHSDCDCCRPTWTVAADAVFMERARPDSLVLMQDAGDPTRNLNANSFDFNFHPGWDLSIGRSTDRGGLEARWMQIDGWDAATSAIIGAPTLVRINSFVPFFLPGVTTVSSRYNSELASGETERPPLPERSRPVAGRLPLS